MTIASELEDLQTNLTNAKDAVVAKGGTVGDTGLAGLASEIENIPSGGGGSEITGYGRLVYYWDYSKELSIRVTGGSGYISNPYRFSDWWEDAGHPKTLSRSGNTWKYTVSGTTYTISDLNLNSIGLMVTPTSSSARVSITENTIINRSSGQRNIDLNASGFEALSALSGSGTAEIQGSTVLGVCVAGYFFGPEVTTVGDNFLKGFANFEHLDTAYAYNVTTIGEYFMYNTDYACGRFEMSSLTSIGAYSNIRGTVVSLPVLTAIPNSSTIICNSIDVPLATSIGNSVMFSAYGQKSNISTVDLVIEGPVSIGNLFGARNFHKITFTNLESIGNNFLKNCQVGNHGNDGYGDAALILEWPKLKTIGENFMNSENLYNVRFTLPSTVTSIGQGFIISSGFAQTQLYNSAIGSSDALILVECPPSVVQGATTDSIHSASYDNYTKSSTVDNCPMYAVGVIFWGTYKDEWLEAFPTSKWLINESPERYVGRKTTSAGAS